MGQILPGVVVAFENPKGGVGKSTLTALFAGYIHSQSNEEGGLSIAVVDIDDMQNTIGKLREDEAEDGIMKKEEEYEGYQYLFLRVHQPTGFPSGQLRHYTCRFSG